MTRLLAALLAAWGAGVSIAVGALVLVMVMNVTRARWFAPMRRPAQTVALTLPLYFVLLAPIALGARALYPAASDPSRPWMHPVPLAARGVLFFAVWIAFAELIRRSTDVRRRALSAVGLPAVLVTFSFAVFDWLMPVTPEFVSDMLGLYVSAAGFSAATGLVAFLTWRESRGVVASFHALGRVLTTSVALWAYLAFFMFLIIWIADIPRESRFYIERARDGWSTVSAMLVFGRFVIPFFLLLSRPLKRRPAFVGALGMWIVIAHVTDIWWLVLPAWAGGPQAMDIVPMVVVAIVAVLFGRWRRSRTPSPPREEIAHALAYESR